MSQPEPNIPVTVTVVDDDKRVADTIATYLTQLDCRVQTYTSAESYLAALTDAPSDIVVSDICMPHVNGIELLRRIRAASPKTDVIMVSGAAEKADAVQALKLGAFDFFEKPVNGDELLETIKRTIRYRTVIEERDRYAQQVSALSERDAKKWGISAFVGKTPAIRDCLREIRLLQSSARTSVLITGESGTGKELVARAIHFGSQRSRQPFIPVNCSAVPKELAESILFGHVKGSFTGAVGDRKGCFEMADGGTLFLDEIGDMSAEIQTKLLRVLEDGVITAVGTTSGKPIDVRVLAATNADIGARLTANAFRRDLFYRLAAFHINIPPLRDRRADIPLLAEHFLKSLGSEMGRATSGFSDAALEMLKSHPFPGNVRELKNVIERALIECAGKQVQPEHLHLQTLHGAPAPAPVAAPTQPSFRTADSPEDAALEDLPLNLKQAEAVLIRKALQTSEGNVSMAARLLGISRPKLYRKMAAGAELVKA